MLAKAVIPRESEIKIEMRKASFGGDRSEAGRYAANIRWQGHTKRELKEEQPKGSSSNPITQRLIDAQNNLKAKGYKVKKYEQKQRLTGTVPSQTTSTEGDIIKFGDLQKILGQELMATTNDRVASGATMMNQAMQYFRDTDEAILFTVEKDGQVVGAAVLYMPLTYPNGDEGTKGELVYAGSLAKVSGTGSALFAEVLKTVASAEKTLFLKSLDDAYPFWKSMGFNMMGSFGTMGNKKVSEMAKDLP